MNAFDINFTDPIEMEPALNSQRPTVLATDLDGTLIPLENVVANEQSLLRLKEALTRHNVTVCFVTGRHFESVQNAIAEHKLPTPNWIISDVGTTIRQLVGDHFKPLGDYRQHLLDQTAHWSTRELKEQLADVKGVQLQESEKQGQFKLSFYAQQENLAHAVVSIQKRLDELHAPYSVIDSVDPFNGDGLIDLLPTGVSKAYALRWWGSFLKLPLDQIIFAGDSGNDMAALTSGFRSILAGNARHDVAQQVVQHFAQRDSTHLFYDTAHQATCAVLAGCEHFGMFKLE